MLELEERSPAADGLAMPAEWEPHARCWMQWPARGDLWGERLPEVYRAYAEVARAIARFEPVSMVARPDDEAQARLACGPDVEVVPLEIDDSWARDTGPIFVTDGNGGVAGVHWQFNGWGNVYHGYANDAAVGGRILERLGMRVYSGPMVLEGGSVCVDGQGTLLTTEECLLNDNRNPELTHREIEERLALFFGVRKIVWLDRGLVDDETSGHVDGVACFAAPGRVLLHMPEDPADPNYERMVENRTRLTAATDAHGRRFEIVEVPQTRNTYPTSDGRQAGDSYINFYIANGAVIVPSYHDPHDAKAAEIIGSAFPGRDVVQVPGSEIARGGGVIHCITQQQPAGTALT